jgi:hypothetical protein
VYNGSYTSLKLKIRVPKKITFFFIFLKLADQIRFTENIPFRRLKLVCLLLPQLPMDSESKSQRTHLLQMRSAPDPMSLMSYLYEANNNITPWH